MPTIQISLYSWVGIAPFSRHWHADIEEEGERIVRRKFPSEYLAKVWLQDIVKEKYQDYKVIDYDEVLE